MSDPSSMDARQQRYDALLQRIGGTLLAAAPPGWRRLDLIATIGDGVQDVGLTVIMSDFTDALVAPPAVFRLLDSAEGATCLERVGDEWQVADYERGKPRGPQRFAQLWDAGAFLLGSLTIIPSSLRGGVKDRNTAAALNDWPVQPLPGEPPLTLLAEKRIAVLMPGRELVRYGAPGGNLTFAAGSLTSP